MSDPAHCSRSLMPKTYLFHGIVTFDEYLECHKVLAKTRRAWARVAILVYGLGLWFYGTALATSRPVWVLIIVGALAMVYGVFLMPLYFRYRVKRNWDHYPRIKREFNLTLSEDGLRALDDKGNPSHTDWNSFIRFDETESLFLAHQRF